MQSVGAVWTDGDASLTDVIFEGFDQDGNSLGTINAGDIADDFLMGTTAEDRFFGVSFVDGVTTGVSGIKITNVGGTGLEIDHIQYANCSDGCGIELPFETELRLDSAGNLVIEDINGGVSKDTLTVQSDTVNGRFVVTDPNNTLTTSIPGATTPDRNTTQVPFVSVPGALVLFNTLAQDDSVTIDFSLGNFTKGITYDGGTLLNGDTIEIRGGGPFAATFNYVDDSTGTVNVTGNGTISYSGLDQISSMLLLTDAILNFSDAADVITVSDAGPASQTTIDSTAGVRTTLSDPSSSLRIEAGAGNDTIDINGLGSDFGAELSIDGSPGIDRIRFNSSLNLRNNISVVGETVAMAPGTTVDAGDGEIFASARWGIVASRLVSTATVRLESEGGGIANTGVADRPYIQATSAVIRSATSVGAAGHNFGTRLSQLDVVANGAGIFIENEGALVIGRAEAPNGVVDITTLSPLAIAGPVRAKVVTLTAAESDDAVSAKDNLTLRATANVEATSGEVNLNAGDDLSIEASAHVFAATAIEIRLDSPAADNDSFGSVTTIAGQLQAKQTNVTGGNNSDAVHIVLPPAPLHLQSIEFLNGSATPWPENRLAGDVDENGIVEFVDFLKLVANFGKVGAVWAAGDFDGNGKVGFADFLALAANFGGKRPVAKPAAASAIAADAAVDDFFRIAPTHRP